MAYGVALFHSVYIRLTACMTLIFFVNFLAEFVSSITRDICFRKRDSVVNGLCYSFLQWLDYRRTVRWKSVMLLSWMFVFNSKLWKKLFFSIYNFVNVSQPLRKNCECHPGFYYQCTVNDAIFTFLKRYGFSFFFDHRWLELLKRSTVHDGDTFFPGDIFPETHFSLLSVGILFGRTVEAEKFLQYWKLQRSRMSSLCLEVLFSINPQRRYLQWRSKASKKISNNL